MKPRAATAVDLPAVLALNRESEHFLSPLDAARLALLARQAAAHWVIESDGVVAAFLLAFREGAAYDSPNYRWFAQRYPRFLYIDRVVVADAAKGQGLGKALYQVAFSHAEANGVPMLACEFDLEPPNPVSAGFHARMGFREVGQQRVAGGSKVVSLQSALVGECVPPTSDA